MRVSEVMTRDVKVVHPNQSIAEAAKMMTKINVGFMPVGENDQLVGTLTDRDIVVRAVAGSKGPYTAVRDVMTQSVKYCFEDEELDQVARRMGEQRVRRMPVVNRDKRLVGVITLCDVALAQPDEARRAITAMSQPGGATSQLRLAAL